MTLGTNPEELALGYLYNQRLLERIQDIKSVEVDWERETVNVFTRHGRGIPHLEDKLAHLTVLSGCGQGTQFSCTMDKLYEQKTAPGGGAPVHHLPGAQGRSPPEPDLPPGRVGSTAAVCAGGAGWLWRWRMWAATMRPTPIAGRMWLDEMTGEDKILFTTGRLTSEIMMKTAFMGIPVLISKSGVTQMGLEFARDMGIVVIGRARVTRFLVF